jgi:isopentenyl diphosphate isomerase/L-lactate dehydrogenase-like FMN-dependent dehydrogenase
MSLFSCFPTDKKYPFQTCLRMTPQRDSAELRSVEDFQAEGMKRLAPEAADYIYRGTESEGTLRRNVEAYDRLLLRRRVLQGIDNVETGVSYFDGKVAGDLPFFPAPINTTPMYANALPDILRISRSFHVPIFISHFAVSEPLELSKIPSMVPDTSPLIWQIYFRRENYEECFKQAALAKDWGYRAIAVTVDAERNVKLRNGTPAELASHSFSNITPADIKRLRRATNLPLIVKGVMTGEDSEVAVECGADGVVVSNHGGRVLDCGQASVEVLPEVVKTLKSRKKTRGAEVFLDGGIRRGTDILKALALGARGCLLGRAIFYGLACDRETGAERVMRILEQEVVRAAALCGVRKLSRVSPAILRQA